MFSDLGPILTEAEDRQASEGRELAYLCSWYVVTALVLALAFSALDVVGGQLSDSAVTAQTSEEMSGEGDLSLQSPSSRIFVSYPGESACICKEIWVGLLEMRPLEADAINRQVNVRSKSSIFLTP